MARRHSSYYDDYWPRYTPTSPIAVRDGIVAKSQRGRFVQNWWADRWIESLTGLMDAGRLSRGRGYARRGQVLQIDIVAGEVSARVQGSQRRPYRVQIWLEPLRDDQWDQVFDALAEQAIFAAQLLNGEMPPDIEEVFAALQVPLFPARRGDLKTDCSCPDWANPCKHIAAVAYLLGERFDEDPFLLFALRGRSVDDIAAALRMRRAVGSDRLEEGPETYLVEAVEAVDAPALADCLEGFWSLGPGASEVTFQLTPPSVDMPLLKRLGAPGFLDARRFWAHMERAYDGVTRRALQVAFADSGERADELAESGQLVVLTMVQQGKISPQEADALLAALEE